MLTNNYHCCNERCSYQTKGNDEQEAAMHLVQDGGYDRNKQTMCPMCKQDSLVFVGDKYK